MLANPDNPAGTYLSGGEVRRLHERLTPEILLVLDSAYTEYVSAPDYENPLALIKASTNVVMTRTFSKVFGLAGLRVNELGSLFRFRHQPWRPVRPLFKIVIILRWLLGKIIVSGACFPTRSKA